MHSKEETIWSIDDDKYISCSSIYSYNDIYVITY